MNWAFDVVAWLLWLLLPLMLLFCGCATKGSFVLFSLDTRTPAQVRAEAEVIRAQAGHVEPAPPLGATDVGFLRGVWHGVIEVLKVIRVKCEFGRITWERCDSVEPQRTGP